MTPPHLTPRQLALREEKAETIVLITMMQGNDPSRWADLPFAFRRLVLRSCLFAQRRCPYPREVYHE